MHVLRVARVAEVGAWGRRRGRTDQIRVRHRHQIQAGAPLLTSIPPVPIRLSYENGIQTFDTADVGSSSQILYFLHL